MSTTVKVVTRRELAKRFGRDRILTGPRAPGTSEIVAHPKTAMRSVFR